MSEEAAPEPDRVEGAPHPRETLRLIGQEAAEAAFLEAYNSGRLHHGWLITGPRGVGKATLAWAIARFLLATPEEDAGGGLFGDAPAVPDTLAIDSEHAVARRILAGAEPGLKLIRRTPNPTTGRLRDVIAVDDVRGLGEFLSLSSADGGRRVVIVDAADEMNTPAANALLKMLEEPPAKTYILLVSHQPSRLLPTIRSRCRELRLSPLDSEKMAEAMAQAEIEPGDGLAGLAALSGGSVGEAVRLITLGGLELYAELVGLIGTVPRLDRARALRFAEAAAARNAADKLDMLIGLIELFLARMAKAGAVPPSAEAVPGERELFARLAPDAHAARKWAAAADEISARLRHGRAVNLDASSLILDTILKIRDSAA